MPGAKNLGNRTAACRKTSVEQNPPGLGRGSAGGSRPPRVESNAPDFFRQPGKFILNLFPHIPLPCGQKRPPVQQLSCTGGRFCLYVSAGCAAGDVELGVQNGLLAGEDAVGEKLLLHVLKAQALDGVGKALAGPALLPE